MNGVTHDDLESLIRRGRGAAWPGFFLLGTFCLLSGGCPVHFNGDVAHALQIENFARSFGE